MILRRDHPFAQVVVHPITTSWTGVRCERSSGRLGLACDNRAVIPICRSASRSNHPTAVGTDATAIETEPSLNAVPHCPQPCPANRPRAPWVSSCAHELDAAPRSSLPHRHRTLWGVWRNVACHRVHRDSRGHREDPRPSRRPQHRLQQPLPRTAAACVRSRTPRPPHPRPCPDCAHGCTTAPCASVPVPIDPHRLPDMLS